MGRTGQRIETGAPQDKRRLEYVEIYESVRAGHDADPGLS
jgi:hypothetical protein